MLSNFQIHSNNKFNSEFNNASIIECEIFTEKGAPFISIRTNLTKRPIKFLIDTDASISLLAEDVITNPVNRINYNLDLYGVVGREVCVKTLGMVHSIFAINGRLLTTTLHLIDRRYSVPGDGYLGYDFFCPYGTIINMNKMKIQIDLSEIVRRIKINPKGDSSKNHVRTL